MQNENNDLLNGSDTVQDVQVKASENPILTQVTSVAAEEERTGTKIQTPTAEELVTRASSSMIVNTKRINDLIVGRSLNSYKISRKGMNRVLLAILSLPTEGIPVTLKSNEEKLAFALGQRLISDRFILMQHHISEELRNQRLKKEEQINNQTTDETVNNQGENNEQA